MEKVRDKQAKITYSLRNKLILLIAVAMIPLLSLTVYIIFALQNYSNAYDSIVSNMTVANSYNLNFKEELAFHSALLEISGNNTAVNFREIVYNAFYANMV